MNQQNLIESNSKHQLILQKHEIYFKIALFVITFLGISGGVLFTKYIDAKIELDAMKKNIINLKVEINEYAKEKVNNYLVEHQSKIDSLFSDIKENSTILNSIGKERTLSQFTILNPRMGGKKNIMCPEGSYVAGMYASKGVGGSYAVDGISEIIFFCYPLKK